MRANCVFCSKKAAEQGYVMVYESFDSIKALKLSPGQKFQNKFGIFKHETLTDLGQKVMDDKNKGFVYTANPTPEIWTKGLKHRTQILYRADIAAVLGHLDVKPGDVVLEAGTGSGSLSVALARAVMPSGKLFTFEFNEFRAEEAAKEFKDLGLDVVSECRDVIQEGFSHPLFERADSIFLDLPSPWLAVPKALEVLKSGGAICTFCPCIEQSQKSVEALTQHGVQHANTIETLLRPYTSQSSPSLSIKNLPEQERVHTGYLTFAYKP